MWEYVLDNDGRFCLNGRQLDTIAFFVSYDYGSDEIDQIRGTLHKHGSLEFVLDYERSMWVTHLEFRMHDCFADTQFFVLDVTDIARQNIEEVNKCISITGYVGNFMRKFDILPDRLDHQLGNIQN